VEQSFIRVPNADKEAKLKEIITQTTTAAPGLPPPLDTPGTLIFVATAVKAMQVPPPSTTEGHRRQYASMLLLYMAINLDSTPGRWQIVSTPRATPPPLYADSWPRKSAAGGWTLSSAGLYRFWYARTWLHGDSIRPRSIQ